MSDDKPTGPEYHDTKQIPRVEVPGNTLDAVLSEVRAMRVEQQETAHTLRADIQLVANDVSLVKQRVSLVERRQDDHEERAKNNSVRARSVTENDSKQDGAIATLVADVSVLKTDVKSLRETQGTQLAILERLDKVAANPMVRRVAYAVGSAILVWLTARGWLSK